MILGRSRAPAGRGPGRESFESALRLYEEGRFEEAIEQFSLAARHGYRRDSVENNIGACYQLLGRLEDAERHYRAALDGHPRNLFALKNLGRILRDRGSWHDAEKLLAKAMREEPQDVEVRFGLVQCLLRTDRYPRAARVLGPLLDDKVPDALLCELFRELAAVGAFQDIADIWSRLSVGRRGLRELTRVAGEAYLETDEPDRAAELFRKLFEEGGEALDQSLLGLAELAAGRKESGLKHVREAERRAGEDPEVLQNVAFALHGNDGLEEVLGIYGRLAELRPDDSVVWNNWGNALYNLGRFRESISKFAQAIERNPDYEIAWNNIGNALEKMGLYLEALPYHGRAAEIAPDFDYAHYAEATALQMLGRSDEAVRAIDRAVALSPRFPEAWALKARLELGSSPDDAVKYAERALLLDPGSTQQMMLMATALSAAGRFDRAELLLQKAKKRASESCDREQLLRLEETIMTGLHGGAEGGSDDRRACAEGAEPATSEEESHHWYRTGVYRLRRGDLPAALRFFRMSYLIDRESSAALAMLLKYETQARRLREYLSAASRLASDGLATPTLRTRIEEAAKRLDQ